MKKLLIISAALLLLWGCSKKDDDDGDKIFKAESLSLEASKTLAAHPQKSTSEQSKLTEEELAEIKEAFTQAENKLGEAIQLKFTLQDSAMTAEIGMRCEETDVEKLKDCLKNIQRSLEQFMREASGALQDADDPQLKEEIAKYNLSTKWFSKISKSIYMVR